MGWEKILAKYQNSLSEIIQLIRNKEDEFLTEEYYDTDFKGYYQYSFVIEGMIHHDIYHLGQIGIVIKLLKENK